jgi:hypothetical protein
MGAKASVAPTCVKNPDLTLPVSAAQCSLVVASARLSYAAINSVTLRSTSKITPAGSMFSRVNHGEAQFAALLKDDRLLLKDDRLLRDHGAAGQIPAGLLMM